MSSLYQYESLNENSLQIRVLHLVKNVGEEKLLCRIETVNVDEAEFTALSYKWGDPDQCGHINIIDSDDKALGIIHLTKNLHDALHDLRDSTTVSAKTFWIDQVCIHQNDDKEKGHQVALMAKIYSNAAEVITYMGPEEPHDHEAISLLHRIYQHYLPRFRDVVDHWMNNRATPFPTSLRLDIDANDSDWKALCGIMGGSWSTRLWMAQESVLNQNTFMLRGSRIFHRSIVQLFFSLIFYHALPDQEISKNIKSSQVAIADLRQTRNKTETGVSFNASRLIELLYQFHGLAHRDPRDGIYALLGIAEDADRLGIVPSYTDSVEIVYIESSLRILHFDPWLLILRLWVPLKDRRPGLPSWVPSFDRWDAQYGQIVGTVAGGTIKKYSWDGSILTIAGLHIATIGEKLGVFQKGLSNMLESGTWDEFNSYTEIIRKAREGLEKQSNIQPHDRESMLYRTIRSRFSLYDPGAAAVQVALNTAMDMVKRELIKRSPPEIQLEQLNLNGSDMMKNDIQKTLTEGMALDFMRFSADYGRSLCFTTDGLLCLAPPDTEPGDLVIAFLGGHNLFILRETGSKKHIFLGDASIDGSMTGQVFGSSAQNNWHEKVRDFDII